VIQKLHLGGAKAPGLDQKKQVNIRNMNLFFLIQPRKLSH